MGYKTGTPHIGDDDYNQDDLPSPLIRHPLSAKYGAASVDEIVAGIKARCDVPSTRQCCSYEVEGEGDE